MAEQFILATQAAAYAFTAWRLFALGLAPRQAGLIGYLLLRCLLGLSSWVMPAGGTWYFWTYVLLTPLESLAGIAAVQEVLGLVLDEYPGIRTIGRWTMYGAVAVALVSSLVLVAAFWRGAVVRSNLYYIQVANRSVVFSLAVILLSLLIFFSYYPLTLTRNRTVSVFAFGAIFLSEAVTLFIDSMAPRLYSPIVDLLGAAFASLCVVVWGGLLRPEPETARTGRPPQEGNERLLGQLRALDQAATRLGHG